MKKTNKNNWLNVIGAILIIIGATSIFPENDTWLHTTLQISFVVGCFVYLLGVQKANKVKNSTLGLAFILSFTIPTHLPAQEYSKQIKAFEDSFNQKDVSIIRPFLSDSLKFPPLPVQNTLPIITNIVTKLPELKSLQIQNYEQGNVSVKYDFEQLGISESHIQFNSKGKIIKIEFVENLIKQEIEEQQKLKKSVQQPQLTESEKKYKPKAVEFKSTDGLIISGNLYEVDKSKPVILLCHQAGYNKMEYADIAPRLNELGYNCLAIDQRSGGAFAGKPNETFQRAKEKELATDYLDAQKDIKASIDYLNKIFDKKIIIWGSSYSSSLVLFESLQNENVKASISFSPGDYFDDKKQSLKIIFSELKKPFFVTSSKQEATILRALVDVNKLKENQIQFIPQSDGFHGSKTLWNGQKGADEYWIAITEFLKSLAKD
jgi:dienelactone hydrolase